MAFLTAISGTSFGRRFDIDQPEIILGRHPECDVTIDVGAVSRQHAKIKRKGDDYYLEDLRSRNGTFLNGQLTTSPTLLSDGDLIRICDVEYSYHDDRQPGFLPDRSTAAGDGSSFGVVFVDDNGHSDSARAVSSKLDIRGSQHGSQLTTTAETRLKAVLEIAQNLGRTILLDDVLPKVLSSLFKIFLQADRAFIVLSEGDELAARWIKTRKEEHEETFRISRTVIREVMQSKQAIISLDATSDERFEMANSISDFRIRSMIVAPLLDSEGNALGAIQMDTLDSKRRFEPGDLEVLAGVAMQAGVAIENAQLHERLVHQQRVEHDLMLAHRVQKAFLPVRPWIVEGYSFYHFYDPAEHVGGDYFDYIGLADGRLAVVTADVSGHGVAAAMLMAKLSAETRFLLASHSDPALAITRLNSRLHVLNVDMFITMLCLVIEPTTGKVEIVNAGHMRPLWLRRDGSVEQPGDNAVGVPIGVIDDFEYELASLQLAEGERLVLYTDGINETPDPDGNLFGIDRLINYVRGRSGKLDTLGADIVNEVLTFAGGKEQVDDMCLVVVSRLDREIARVDQTI
ncbi:MAG: SpoIIE family protein phosphatase [Planctomycetales bacterium]|nr:SpoIIE family protein phosphatase [Planctomycetales bacterium]